MSEGLIGALYYDIQADGSAAIRQLRSVDESASKLEVAFNRITSAVKVYAAALALVKAAKLADEMRMLGARVEVAAGSIENGAAALGALQRIAARTQTDLATTAGVFNRLNQSILQMGGNQNDTLQITELLGQAIKVSGASGAEASSAMTQFGQALGSGKLAGDELRSLLENAPYLMQQLARGIGVPVGALKQLGEEGKLTADVVVNALRASADTIAADFKKLPQTFDAALGAAADQAKRANEALDTLSGSSAALTGIARGTGDALGMIADQLLSVTTEADKLERGKAIETWTTNTTLALSYVVDAGDFVIRGFRQIGLTIYETAMAAKAAATGGFQEAGERLAGLKQQLLEIGGAQYAGAKIRQRIEALASGTDGSDTMDRRARAGTPSKLKGGGDGKGKDKTGQFDAIGYLAKLREATANEYEKIGLVEQDALRKNAQQAGLTTAQRAQAEQLIREKAAQDRIRLQERVEEQILRDSERAARERERVLQMQAQGQSMARGLIVSNDPAAQVQAQLEQELAQLQAFYETDLANQELYEQARVAARQRADEQLRAIRDKHVQDELNSQLTLLGAAGSFFAASAELIKQHDGEQSSAYKAAFALQKGFAIAQASLNLYTAAMSAFAAPENVTTAQKFASYAAVLSAGGSLLSAISGASYGGGRMSGGMVGSGTMVKVNEAGRPEMFTAANGAQYMLPTADGKVTAAGDGGGGAQPIVLRIVNEFPAAQVTQRNGTDGRPEVVISQLIEQIESNSGPFMSALKRSTNVRSAL